MSIGPIREVLVGVRDPETALRLFCDVIGLRVESDRAIPTPLRLAWGLPSTTCARIVELSCEGHPAGRLRLIAYEPPPGDAVRADSRSEPNSATDIGPKALDLYTSKPIAEAVSELERAGFPPRSRPIRYQIGPVQTEELLFTGPDGLAILVMHAEHGPEFQQPTGTPTGYSEIPTVSVVCADLDQSRRFYRETLGLELALDAEVGADLREVVCELTGIPAGTRIHMLLFKDADEPSGKYLLLHYFSASTGRLHHRMRPGLLGLSLYSHRVDDLDGLSARLAAGAAELVMDTGQAPARVQAEPRRLLARGPNDELFEFVEEASA